MKRFENMSEADLEKVMHFAEEVLETRRSAAVDYASMPADESVLDEAEENARAFARAKRQRKSLSTIYDEPSVDEEGSVRDRLREWAKKGRRIG